MSAPGLEPRTSSLKGYCSTIELRKQNYLSIYIYMEGAGFEPTKQIAKDLQSSPFGHLDTP